MFEVSLCRLFPLAGGMMSFHTSSLSSTPPPKYWKSLVVDLLYSGIISQNESMNKERPGHT